ncbi:MAG: hypothetical protein MI725_12350 [Pirellulales bacterium]|nr:hypothetical protein [Pirellulales bacterium]
MTKQPPITDSPWLWFGLFSAVGLVALVATGGKYGHRQATLERKAQARQAVAEGMEVQEDAAGRKTVQKAPKYSKPGEPKIPLTPLAVTLGAIFAVCLTMLVREQSRRRNDQAPMTNNQ